MGEEALTDGAVLAVVVGEAGEDFLGGGGEFDGGVAGVPDGNVGEDEGGGHVLCGDAAAAVELLEEGVLGLGFLMGGGFGLRGLYGVRVHFRRSREICLPDLNQCGYVLCRPFSD